VRIRNRSHDCKTQPGPGRVPGSAAETLERARHETGGEALSLVDDVQLE
jgi:hypothetical protein